MWLLGFKNLFRNKRRSLITGVSIIFGYCGMMMLSGHIWRVERYLRATSVYLRNTGHISIYKKGAIDHFTSNPEKFQITGEEISKIKTLIDQNKDLSIENTGLILTGAGLVSNGCRSVPFLSTGIDPELDKWSRHHPQVQKWNPEFANSGSKLKLGDVVEKRPDVISVASGLADLLGKTKLLKKIDSNQNLPEPTSFIPNCNNLEDIAQLGTDPSVQLAATSFSKDFSAVNAEVLLNHFTGFTLTENVSLISSLKLMQNLFQTDGATYMALYLDQDASVGTVVKKLNHLFEESQLNLEAFPFWNDQINLFYAGSMQFLYIMGAFFVFLICSAVALAVSNAQTMNVIERTKEMGILRSIGFSKKEIKKLFFIEGFELALASVVIGWIFTEIVLHVFNSMNFRLVVPGIAGDISFLLIPSLFLKVLFAVFTFGATLLGSAIGMRGKTQKTVSQLLTDPI